MTPEVNGIVTILEGLYGWLANLQVNVNEIPIIPEEGKFFCTFNHPIKGKVKCEVAKGDLLVRLAGVGFRIVTNELDTPIFAKCIDYGGIFDPQDGFVPGDHYSASHFALICTVLHALNPGKEYIENAKKAFVFQKNKYPEYLFTDWPSHLEFDNFAWAEIYNLLEGDTNFRQEVLVYLQDAPQHKLPYATNWKLLAQNYLATIKPTNFIKYLYQFLRKAVYSFFIDRSIKKDGCIEDIPNKSRSIQYHAFSGALLSRWMDKSSFSRKRYKNALLGAALYLSKFIDPDGNFNYKGRGQQQIFGYISGIYLLLSGIEYAYVPQKASLLAAATKVFNYFSKVQESSGRFPLILNDDVNTNQVGWHDYHHLTVYNAMAGAWLGLICSRFPHFQTSIPSQEFSPTLISYLNESKTLVGKYKNIFICLSAGEDHYETDCGLAFHHVYFDEFGAVVSCPGGPDKLGLGAQTRLPDMDFNFYAPLLIYGSKIVGPGNKVGSMRYFEPSTPPPLDYLLSSNMILYEEGITVTRSLYLLPNGFRVFDTIHNNSLSSVEIIACNLPMVNCHRYTWDLSGSCLTVSTKNNDLSISFGNSLISPAEYQLNIYPTVLVLGSAKIIQSARQMLRSGQSVDSWQEWRLSK